MSDTETIIKEWAAMCGRYKQERDEARAERDKLQAMRREVVAANKGAKINAQINNSLTAKLAEAKRELDAIRAVFGHGANDADWKPGTALAEAVEKVMRERGEARKALVRSNHFLQQAEENLDLVYKERNEARARLEIITPSKNNPVAEYFSSSSTPETDVHEFYYDGKTGFVEIDFCRKMERERNEAILVMRETRRRLDAAWLEIERLKNP